MSTQKEQISCIILAGGKNIRMGREKALLSLGNKTIIEAQKDNLGQIFEEVIIVTNYENNFKNIDAKVVKDVIPGLGPLGGLYSGLSASSNIHSFLIGCDMPFVNLELVKYMIRQVGENEIVIPLSANGVEPLFAFYSLSCLESIKRQIEQKNLKLLALLNSHNVRYICQEEVRKYDPDGLSFFNINYPLDYELALKIWKKTRLRKRK